MKPRTQCLATLALGTFLFCSPWLFAYRDNAAGNAWAFGLAVSVVSLWALIEPQSRTPQVANIGLGIWVFFVPWLLGFEGATSPSAWIAWISGATIAGLSVWALELIAATRRQA